MKCINPEPNRNCKGTMKSNKDEGYSWLADGKLECDTCGYRADEKPAKKTKNVEPKEENE